MKFTVKRDEWFRGKGATLSKLLNNDGYKCCLGFYSLACGLKEEDIQDKIAPMDLTRELLLSTDLNKLVEDRQGYLFNTSYCNKLMTTNAAVYLTDAEREVELTKLFAEIGIEVKFV